MGTRRWILAAALCGAAPFAGASNCEELRAQIEAKIRSAGVSSLSVTVVDAAASAPGRVVGHCDRGAKKIVYLQGAAGRASPAAAPTPPAPPARSPRKRDDIITECADGSMSVGGECKKRSP